MQSDIPVPFTMADRDMMRDTHAIVQDIVNSLQKHEDRVDSIERDVQLFKELTNEKLAKADTRIERIVTIGATVWTILLFIAMLWKK